ncbi:hypothetical protein COU61_01250, partial [Candidatus Pacearchaeota archaeon CG10_big_fil_rev_8_21_14_0_10_35_13]
MKNKKMMNETKTKMIMIIIGMIMITGGVSALTTTSYTNQYQEQPFQQYYSNIGVNYNEFWPNLGQGNSGICEARQDFLLQIPPGSCSPMVVRSDLLESQNVPVFCPVVAIKINPLIDVNEITSISFTGRPGQGLPEGIAGISYHPYRAGVTNTNLGQTSDITNRVGYVVILLKKNPVEDKMPETITANLTATIRYDTQKIFGLGNSEYYLQKKTDKEWEETYPESSFYKGRGYLRLEELSEDGQTATVGIYNNKDDKYKTVTLQRGKASSIVYLPGFYCSAGITLNYDAVGIPKKKVKLQVDNEEYWFYEGERFLNGQCTVNNIIIPTTTATPKTTTATITCPTQRLTLSIDKKENKETEDKKLEDIIKGYSTEQQKNIKENYELLIKESKEITQIYGGEVDKERVTYYGLEALEKTATLAKELQQYKTEKEILELIISYYGNSPEAQEAGDRIRELETYDYKDSTGYAIINYQTHTISLLDTKNPGAEQNTVEINTGKETKKLTLNDYVYGSSGGEYLRIIGMRETYITIEGRTTGNDKNYVTNNYQLRQGQTLKEAGVLISKNWNGETKIEKINLKEEARIRVTPSMPQTISSANFTFGIGIEKRSIQLSTEKTQDMIKNLNNSIERWDGITENLGKAVETGKALCLATSAGLMIKNFFNNMGGIGEARQEVMRGTGGWIDKCKAMMSSDPGAYQSLDDCLRKNSAAIDLDVQLRAKNANKEETTLNSYLERYPGDPATAQSKWVEEVFIPEIKSSGFAGQTIKVGSTNKVIYGEGGVWENEAAVMKSYNDGTLTIDDAKEILISKGTSNGNTQTGLGSAVLQEKLRGIALNPAITSANYAGVIGNHKIVGLNQGTKIQANEEVVQAGDKTGIAEGKYLFLSIPANPSQLELRQYAGKVVVIPIKKDSTGTTLVYDTAEGREWYVVNNFNENAVKQSGSGDTIFTEWMTENKISGGVQSIEKDACSNVYQNPKAKYYQSGESKGLPMVVPVDLNTGWYAGTKESGFQKPYTEAGMLQTFWLCNVGRNGMEEFDRTGADDKESCFQVNLNTGQPVDQSYGCFDAAGAKNMINKAQAAIKAAGQYNQQKKNVIIPGMGGIPTELTTTSLEGTQCQDFMSPSDCNILFNVCDPVMCPSSRCNLGGNYYVEDVIQSGIAGSIALCLPNAKEGIIVPVCLTGIYAGMNAYTSILKAHRDCLQNSLVTGENTGICDEMQSIYMCDFFWKQATPIIKAGLPTIINGVFGQGARGGGEYSDISKSWDRTKASMDYFTQTYATNAFQSFNLRSTDNIGTEFCKAFVSAQYPTSADALQELVKPEDPPQFYAQYDEIPYSEATVPPTSQYNVYYHIYSGKNQGVYYSVYLKDPPERNLYAQQETILVKQGYINAGEYSDEKKEFTAPQGYGQLCIRINNQEKCGFEKVTTDYGINYLTEQYAKEQATTSGIKTESECINGEGSIVNPDAYGLVNLNLQQGVTNILSPQAYSQGIIRVCSAQNPGLGLTSST